VVNRTDTRFRLRDALALCCLPVLLVRSLLHIDHKPPVMRQYLPTFMLRLFSRYEHVLLRPADLVMNGDWFNRHFLTRQGSKAAGRSIFTMVNGEVLTLGELHQLIDSAFKGGYTVATGTCPCRRSRQEFSDEVPNNTDMVMGKWADQYIRNYPGSYHALDRKEAHRLAEEFDRHGFIHNVYGVLDVKGAAFVVCNCDPTVCIPFEAQTTHGYPAFRKGRARVYVDEGSCLGVDECGACLARCHFGARSGVDGKSHVDRTLCFGCGLCQPTCAGGATRLRKQKGAEFIYAKDFVN
jgi:ferredoxin